MLAQQKATEGLNSGLAGSIVTGTIQEPVRDDRPTLASLGIDKKLSARAQKMATGRHKVGALVESERPAPKDRPRCGRGLGGLCGGP